MKDAIGSIKDSGMGRKGGDEVTITIERNGGDGVFKTETDIGF
jgi:hypothetical protein